MRWSLIQRWRSSRTPNRGGDVRRLRGRRGEVLAREWLERNGFVIERANVRLPVGEVDLIAREGATLCFIEVRSRTSQAYGGALASIDARKQRRLVRAAQWYMAQQGLSPEAVRFDAVSIEWRGKSPPSVVLVRSAFDAG